MTYNEFRKWYKETNGEASHTKEQISEAWQKYKSDNAETADYELVHVKENVKPGSNVEQPGNLAKPGSNVENL